MLGKSLGTLVHHLIMGIDFDIKKIVTQFVPNDIQKLQDLIRTFESSEGFKKKNIFQGMAGKISFYKKLEIGMIQKGYNKIIANLKEGK